MNSLDQKDKVALSIYDMGSVDCVCKFKDLIRELWKGELILNTEQGNFSRPYSFNRAAKQSPHEKLFICDADMMLPQNFVKQYESNVKEKTIWFPVCFSLYQDKKPHVHKSNGWWRKTGYGIMGLHKSVFFNPCFFGKGGYNEDYKTWGKEDNHFLNIAKRNHFEIVRIKCEGLFHVYHEKNTQWHKKGGA